MRIAIMQPYFVPYAGYFRLLSATDLFVVYDDVQYPKGGWVTRNRLQRNDGQEDWLNVPIKRPPLGTLIKDMQWQPDAKEIWVKESRRFKAFLRERYPDDFLSFFTYYLQDANGRMDTCERSPFEYIMKSIEAACYDLYIGKGVPVAPDIVRSSLLGIPDSLKGQDRVLYICNRFKATEYVNAPDGRHLYDEKEFKRRGVDLKFFCDYPNKQSILDRLVNEKPQDVRKEIDAFSMFS